MKTERKILEERMKSILKEIRESREQSAELKQKLMKHKIFPGISQRVINGDTPLDELELIVLCLFTIKIWEVTNKYPMIDPKEFFTDEDIKEAEQYQEYIPESITFPIIFKNVIKVSNEEYLTVMTAKEVDDLYKYKILSYRFDYQRSPKIEKKKDGGIRKKPNLNNTSVKEIALLLKEKKLFATTLTFNILANGTEEFEYNDKKNELIYWNGSLDILDGAHRIEGNNKALQDDEKVEFTWQISIRNYTIRKGQIYFGQVNTVNDNGITKDRIRSMKEDRHSDFVVRELELKSDLKNRISQSPRPFTSAKELVSFSLLSETIDEVFKLTKKVEAYDLIEYLTKYFDYLIGSFPEFTETFNETYKSSLINNNVTFAGYIVLSKRIQDENISISELPRIIKSINWSKDNPLWEKTGVLQKCSVTKDSKDNIIKFFKNINLKEGAVNE